MDKVFWWHKPLRAIQTNLQVKDTPLMNPAKIADEIQAMEANVLVFNVGGIYAWYNSEIRHHHINEYLPSEFDLISEMIKECHKRDIKFVARFDFSKTDDHVFQEKPQWFVKDKDGKPVIYGKDRMGAWSKLLTTCNNAGYRNDEFAVPAIKEVLGKYDIDGIFLNAASYHLCYCETCQTKYQNKYGKPLPGDPAEFESDWASSCVKETIDKIYGAMTANSEAIPLILYYYHNNFMHFKDVLLENMNDRIMVCTEPQDVLSRGYKDIPQFWKPAISIKMAGTLEQFPRPFGIIHSCPGMDWRHTGLPSDEHMFWMSQIPANGGFIWHSLTGFGDTISDKRIIKSVTAMNNRIKKTEALMENAVLKAQVLLLSNGKHSAEGWAEGMINTQTLFDTATGFQITAEKLRRYKVFIIPEGSELSEDTLDIVRDYASNGGNIIFEDVKPGNICALHDVIGVRQDIVCSDFLAATYIRFENDGAGLHKGFEETPLFPHRGIVAYCKPEMDAKVLATLVPPFASLDAVGAPPERASILTPYTDIPLITLNRFGKGNAVFVPFQLSMLACEYKLTEHYHLIQNIVDLLLGEDKFFFMDSVNGLQAIAHERDNIVLLHFINGIGQRPLANNTPYHGLRFSVKIPTGRKVKGVKSCIEEGTVEYSIEAGMLRCELDVLRVWDMIAIELQ